MSQTITREPAEAVAAPTGSRHAALGFAAIVSGTILNILDSTLVNVAGPSIRADLAMSSSTLEWIAAAYTLALAVGLLTGARLGDMFGRKRLFLAGLAGFVVTSVLCSVAWDASVLVTARALQGVAAALMLPQCFGLLRDVFPPERLPKAFGAMGPVIGLATVIGPALAGVLVDADLFGTGWRSMFWLNVPIGLFAIVIGARVLPTRPPAHRGARLDVGGVALVGLASLLVVFPLVDGHALGWPLWIFGVLAASVPVLVAFAAHQRARQRAGLPTVVELSILRKRSYVSGVVFVLTFFGSLIGFTLTVGLFLQLGLGFSPLRASLYLAALSVGAFVGAGIGGWAATNVGRPILHVGLTVMGVGTAVLWASLHGGGSIGFSELAPGLGLFGLGMGMIFVPLFSIIMGGVDEREVGSASGLLTSMEQLGASLGVAVLGTVFFGTLRIEDGGPVAAHVAGRDLAAIEHALVGVMLAIAVAWAIGWFLPRRAQQGVGH